LYKLLYAAGVESQLTLVNTQAEIERIQPSLDQFNHMIVHVPSLEANGWLDATNKDADITMLPPESL